jgi:hypothetical protein
MPALKAARTAFSCPRVNESAGSTVLIVTLGVNGFFALAASLAIGSALSYLAYSYLNGKGTWTSYET